MKDGTIADRSSVRWWENYLVRYLAGTVVGAFVCAVLLLADSNLGGGHPLYKTIPLPAESANLDDLGAEMIFVLLAAGFAFAYIASAPILVLHAWRGLYLRHESSENYGYTKKDRRKWCFLAFSGPVSVALLAILNIFHASYPILWLVFIVTVLVLLLLLCIKFVLCIFDNELISDFQKSLARNRVNRKFVSSGVSYSAEYVESYRHLRENGNAFFIVTLEIYLGFFLYQMDLGNALFALVLWITPAALVYFVGMRLELSLVNDGGGKAGNGKKKQN